MTSDECHHMGVLGDVTIGERLIQPVRLVREFGSSIGELRSHTSAMRVGVLRLFSLCEVVVRLQ